MITEHGDDGSTVTYGRNGTERTHLMTCPSSRRRFLRGTALALAAVPAASALARAEIAAAMATPTAASGWSQAHPAGSAPLPRDGHGMVDDSTTGTALLFGGKGNGSQYFNDLWAYAPAADAWSEFTPSGSLPPGRFGHAMFYDPTDRTMIVFGGVLGSTNQPANDLWTYRPDTNAWTSLSASAGLPPARTYPSMVYDPATSAAILFGGWTGGSAFNDTWSYESSANAWSKLNPATSPAARWGASMVSDAASGTVILFGGLFGSYDGGSRLNDTWAYDPAKKTWTNLNPTGDLPSARGYAAMSYDAAADRIVLFGGFAGSEGLLADSWAYDRGANVWSQFDPTGPSPSKRDFSAMVYDPSTKTTVLFGGLSGDTGNVNGAVLNDTWRR